MDRIIIID